MKFLIVDDEFVSRRLLQKMLNNYGECDIAANGPEALEAFKLAWADKDPYNLICLDIMMPNMDGHSVLKTIRSLEEEMGIRGLDIVRILMITCLDDRQNIMEAFKGQCDGYLIKPIIREKLLETIGSVGLELRTAD